jgi:perosamine synthetase
MAKNVFQFEKMIADYVGVKRAIGFDSDSSALETVLRYFGINDGEVIVCTNSFISIPNSVVYAGGKVVFADIREDTLSMNHESLLENLSDKTVGVIVTHIAGFPNPELKEIIKTCKKHGLFLIEDATHAIGATDNGAKAGSFGDAAILAFTPTKVLTTGEGGMLITNNIELGDFAKRFSYYGSGSGKTNFVDLGRHMMLPEISAILGIYQLNRIEQFIVRRNEIATHYNEAIDKMNGLHTIECPAEYRCSYYKYPLILSNKLNKEEFVKKLHQEFGMETGTVFYPPCHLQTVYKKLGSVSYQSLLIAEQVLSRTITLPMHVSLTPKDVDFVIEKIAYLYSDMSLLIPELLPRDIELLIICRDVSSLGI